MRMHRILVVAALLVAAALVSPLEALARKLAPHALTAAGALDRAFVSLSPEEVAAARALRRLSGRGAVVAVPLGDDARDPGGALPLVVGALAERRLAAVLAEFSAGSLLRARRWAALERLYVTRDAAEGAAILRSNGIGWVWEDSARPLRFPSSGLVTRWESPSVRLLELRESR